MKKSKSEPPQKKEFFHRFFELIKYLDKKLPNTNKKFENANQRFLDLDNELSNLRGNETGKLNVTKSLKIVEIYTKRIDIYFQILTALNREL